MALEAPTSGSVRLEGRDLYALKADALRSARRDFQMVFQDPFGSLDPRQSVARIVAEPLAALAAPHTPSRSEQRERVAQALDAVGLRQSDLDKFPHDAGAWTRPPVPPRPLPRSCTTTSSRR
jgi:ABC-type microcin C transport system duplicated ATPase subunit YejF